MDELGRHASSGLEAHNKMRKSVAMRRMLTTQCYAAAPTPPSENVANKLLNVSRLLVPNSLDSSNQASSILRTEEQMCSYRETAAAIPTALAPLSCDYGCLCPRGIYTYHKPRHRKMPQLISFLIFPNTCKKHGGWHYSIHSKTSRYGCSPFPGQPRPYNVASAFPCYILALGGNFHA